MKQYNNEDFIVSVTSYGERLKYISPVLNSILNQHSEFSFHVILVIDPDDIIPDSLKLLEDKIEIYRSNENIGSHSKYFWAMKKYWDKPIVTFDDDAIIPDNYLRLFFVKYKSCNFKTIICGNAIKIKKENDKIAPISTWSNVFNRLLESQTSLLAMPEGFAGILYPPKCFNQLDVYLDEIRNDEALKYDDDLFLKICELREGILVTQLHYPFLVFENSFNPIKEIQQYQLHNTKNKDWKNRDELSLKYSNEIRFLINLNFEKVKLLLQDFMDFRY